MIYILFSYTHNIFYAHQIAADGIKVVIRKWHFSDVSLSEADILQSSCLLHGSPQYSFIHLHPCHLANILTKSNGVTTTTTTYTHHKNSSVVLTAVRFNSYQIYKVHDHLYTS